VLLLGLCAAGHAFEDYASAMPEETAIYARAPGLEALLSDLAGCRLFTDGAGIRGAIESALARMWPVLEKETGAPVAQWTELMASVRGAHLGLLSIEREFKDSDFLLAIETEKTELLREVLEKVLTTAFGQGPAFAGEVAGARVMQATDGKDVSFYYAIGKNVAAMAVKPERISAFLTALASPPERSLATSANYRAAALTADPGATLFAYFDGARSMQLLMMLMTGGHRGEGDDEFSMRMKILQLDQLHAACAVSTGGATRVRVLVGEEHRWLQAFRGTPGPCALQTFAPEGCAVMLVDSGPVEKKAAALREILGDKDFFPESEDAMKGMAEAEEMMGLTFLEIAKTLGNEWALFLPCEPGEAEPDEEYLTFAFQIGDREKFDAAMGKFLAGPLAKELGEKEGGIVREAYAGAEILRPAGDDAEVPCMVVTEGTLLMAGDTRALKMALDAKASGRGMLSRAGPFMPAASGVFSKIAAIPLSLLLMEESSFAPLLDMVAPEAVWFLGVEEGAGRLEAVFNQSIPAMVGMLVGGEMLRDFYREPAQQCLGNLRAIGEAIKAYREKNGEDPASLEALVPDFLDKARLVCPFDAGKGVGCTYRLLGGSGEEQDWSMRAYCPHRRHGRLVLYRGGDAWSTREGRFLRELREASGNR
jgi:hypothetical protein